jgi:hypothetical protein
MTTYHRGVDIDKMPQDWHIDHRVSLLVAESRKRTLSVNVVKDVTGVRGTKEAVRLRDEAQAVLRGIIDGEAEEKS